MPVFESYKELFLPTINLTQINKIFFYNIHLLTDKIIVNYLSPNYDKYHDKFNFTNKRLNSLILKDSKKLLIKVLKIKCPVERALDNETLN